jgi:hypothetical protein
MADFADTARDTPDTAVKSSVRFMRIFMNLYSFVRFWLRTGFNIKWFAFINRECAFLLLFCKKRENSNDIEKIIPVVVVGCDETVEKCGRDDCETKSGRRRFVDTALKEC